MLGTQRPGGFKWKYKFVFEFILFRPLEWGLPHTLSRMAYLYYNTPAESSNQGFDEEHGRQFDYPERSRVNQR